MRAASALLAISLLACGRTPAPDEPTPVATGADDSTQKIDPARPAKEPAVNASKRPPNLELLLDKEVTTSAGERIVLSSFVIEDIAENPDDPESSPGGGGLVLQVTVDGERLTFSD
ncbi:MAG: hypothetical protein KJO07_22985, partial [Deltaproteobacteria bacterium]|nr:hypothetical protein [Deltaproteobacteria bacterium]